MKKWMLSVSGRLPSCSRLRNTSVILGILPRSSSIGCSCLFSGVWPTKSGVRTVVLVDSFNLIEVSTCAGLLGVPWKESLLLASFAIVELLLRGVPASLVSVLSPACLGPLPWAAEESFRTLWGVSGRLGVALALLGFLSFFCFFFRPKIGAISTSCSAGLVSAIWVVASFRASFRCLRC